jgi:hypothetical protein
MNSLEHPMPQRRRDMIPLIVYRNGEPLFHVTNYQEAIARLCPLVSCTKKELRDAVWNGAFKFTKWSHGGFTYEFRTSKERQQLGVIKRKKQFK